MAGIAVKNNLILYYGNIAGYVEDGKAVLDPMFKNEYLTRFLQKKGLEPCWQDGVYDRLVHGRVDLTGEVKPIRNCRLHQLRPEVPPEERFLDFEVVYDCQIETDDLETIYTKFEREFPQRSTGHPISISDVIELYDRQGSEFYYVDHYGFQKIGFIQRQSLYTKGADHMKGEDACQRQPI